MNKKIIVIGAVSINGVYGEGERIPWYIPEDFEHFKQLTTNCTVVMGRGTWESLPQKFRPLPNRQNIVITNTPEYQASGATVCSSVEQAIFIAMTEKVFCIGGASVWYCAMNIAEEAWITVVKQFYPITQGVTYCAPELNNPSAKWPNFSFHCMVLEKEAEGVVPGFSIVHWISSKER